MDLLLEQEEIMKLEQQEVLAKRRVSAGDGKPWPRGDVGFEVRECSGEGAGADGGDANGMTTGTGPGNLERGAMRGGKRDVGGAAGGDGGGTNASITIRKQWRHMKRLDVAVREYLVRACMRAHVSVCMRVSVSVRLCQHEYMPSLPWQLEETAAAAMPRADRPSACKGDVNADGDERAGGQECRPYED